MILTFFNLVSGDCCYKVTADYANKNYAYDNHPSKFGEYYLQPGTVNGRAHYEKGEGNKKAAIWYNPKFGKWFVGGKSSLGGDTASFALKLNSECPYGGLGEHDDSNVEQSYTFSWRYWYFNQKWTDANDGFFLVCET